MRVVVGRVEALEGDDAVVSLSDGSTRTLRVPEGEDVAPGVSVRIIEATYPGMAPFVGWGEDDRVAERERLRGYVRATLTLLRTEDGGREGPFASGYRPQWDLGHRTEDGTVLFSDAEVWLEDGLMLNPGATGIVHMHPFFPEYWENVREGSVLGLYEGNRHLGNARVLEVIARPN
jgi:hypothetical protein